MIRELRLLPPLAIARFGARPDADGQLQRGRRPDAAARLPEPHTGRDPRASIRLPGEIAEVIVPARVAFKRERPRPARRAVPRALVADPTKPGSSSRSRPALLEADGVSRPPRCAGRCIWRITRPARRTGDPERPDRGRQRTPSPTMRCDALPAMPELPVRQAIAVRACPVHQPTAAHPEIRLRFTPAGGFVYGANRLATGRPPTADRGWPTSCTTRRRAGPGPATSTRGLQPQPTPAGEHLRRRLTPGRATLPGRHVSDGYLDDGCDGDRADDARARRPCAAGVRAASAPGCRPTRLTRCRSAPWRTSRAGAVRPRGGAGRPATIERVEEIVRRAFETVRLMRPRPGC